MEFALQSLPNQIERARHNRSGEPNREDERLKSMRQQQIDEAEENKKQDQELARNEAKPKYSVGDYVGGGTWGGFAAAVKQDGWSGTIVSVDGNRYRVVIDDAADYARYDKGDSVWIAEKDIKGYAPDR